MTDYISRQAAIDALSYGNEFEYIDMTLIDKYEAERQIKSLPSAQPERKTGEWIEHNPHKWGLGIKFECSECGYEVDCEEPNFCPKCGADMRGGNT